jgi:hypothetical protein
VGIQGFFKARWTGVGESLVDVKLDAVAKQNGVGGDSENVHEEGADHVADDETHLDREGCTTAGVRGE